MEAIEVIARFDQEGMATPLSFTWQGRAYQIDSTGRRWIDGESQHILVLVPGERVFELVFVPSQARWYLGQFGLDRMAA